MSSAAASETVAPTGTSTEDVARVLGRYAAPECGWGLSVLDFATKHSSIVPDLIPMLQKV